MKDKTTAMLVALLSAEASKQVVSAMKYLTRTRPVLITSLLIIMNVSFFILSGWKLALFLSNVIVVLPAILVIMGSLSYPIVYSPDWKLGLDEVDNEQIAVDQINILETTLDGLSKYQFYSNIATTIQLSSLLTWPIFWLFKLH